VPADIAESELFGHERGAFTGAIARKRGLVELSEGGTLLLNEIGELPLPLQSKLLAFLDTKEFLRVGGEKPVRVNARLIAATHRDLKTEVAEGRFLQPLYYRLSVLTVEVPPLRERIEDMPVLVQHLVAELTAGLASPDIPEIDPQSLRHLARYDWPGNIRELRNVIERSLILSQGKRLLLRPPSESVRVPASYPCVYLRPDETLAEAKEDLMRTMCEDALRRAAGNKKEAARSLGISRDTFYRYLRQHEIAGSDRPEEG
jgi:DNA-binding NtrC family response regulator